MNGLPKNRVLESLAGIIRDACESREYGWEGVARPGELED